MDARSLFKSDAEEIENERSSAAAKKDEFTNNETVVLLKRDYGKWEYPSVKFMRFKESWGNRYRGELERRSQARSRYSFLHAMNHGGGGVFIPPDKGDRQELRVAFDAHGRCVVEVGEDGEWDRKSVKSEVSVSESGKAWLALGAEIRSRGASVSVHSSSECDDNDPSFLLGMYRSVYNSRDVFDPALVSALTSARHVSFGLSDRRERGKRSVIEGDGNEEKKPVHHRLGVFYRRRDVSRHHGHHRHAHRQLRRHRTYHRPSGVRARLDAFRERVTRIQALQARVNGETNRIPHVSSSSSLFSSSSSSYGSQSLSRSGFSSVYESG